MKVYSILLNFDDPREGPFGNVVGKEGNVGCQHFLRMLSTASKTNLYFRVTFYFIIIQMLSILTFLTFFHWLIVEWLSLASEPARVYQMYIHSFIIYHFLNQFFIKQKCFRFIYMYIGRIYRK